MDGFPEIDLEVIEEELKVFALVTTEGAIVLGVDIEGPSKSLERGTLGVPITGGPATVEGTSEML